ncbi:MAG: hypothetical protein E7570_01245 [Ruminococcaceae bacterium]|nr:hypothetical protein [Oscillospiraceae bacterium]
MSDNKIQVDDGSQEITFILENIKYTAVVSIGRLLLPDIIDANTFNYKKHVSSVLVDSVITENIPSVETVVAQDDEFFINVFNEFSFDEEFYQFFDDIICPEICEHYIRTYYRYCVRNIPDAVEHLKSNMANTFNDIKRKYFDAFAVVEKPNLDRLGEILLGVFSWYNENSKAISKTITNALSELAEASRKIVSLVNSLDIKEYSEKEKEQLLKSYKQWGRFGWTLPPFAEYDCFHKCPSTQQEADQLIIQCCKKDNIVNLFDTLEEMCSRKKDLKEAIFCYNNRQYKACAMLLFSIIDSRIIRLQKKGEGKLDVGIRAIKKFKKLTRKAITNKDIFFFSLISSNILECLFMIFEDTENFTKETTVVNRNYIDHGMTSKPVRKTDCIKLFILLYNILELIDYIK